MTRELKKASTYDTDNYIIFLAYIRNSRKMAYLLNLKTEKEINWINFTN